jgi:hypothetical protein
MTIDAVTYAYGSQGNPYLGRIELQLYADERFVASYRHRDLASQWNGHLLAGTFAKARDAMSSAGFPEVPRIIELAPGEDPLELGWLRDGVWERGSTMDRNKFWKIRILASTVLSVLDSNLARVPPGETTPVIEHHRVEASP